MLPREPPTDLERSIPSTNESDSTMPKYDRGGNVWKTGKIGRVTCLRQQMIAPGEVLDSKVTGQVRLTAMRERESARCHARLDAFLTPVRWLWDQWPQYLKDGPDSNLVPPTRNMTRIDSLGLGSAAPGGIAQPVPRYFYDSLLRIYNEHYKWPENADITTWPVQGAKATALPISWSRMQRFDGPQPTDYELETTQAGSREKFDIRDLAQLQAKYRNAVERDYIAHDRYVDLIEELFNGKGSREVDKVPYHIDSATLGVTPEQMYATDSGGLGAVMSLYDFQVNHDFGKITANEHMILTYLITVRFESVSENEQNPMLQPEDWASRTGDAGLLSSQPPQPVKRKQISGGTNNHVMGYLPAGWQWRTRWNMVDERFDNRQSFPVYKDNAIADVSADTYRDATNINNCFRSAHLLDYQCVLDFFETSDSPIPGAKSSLFSGAPMSGRGGDIYPGPRRVI